MNESSLAEAVADVHHIILDFDGPPCSLFAGRPASEVADRQKALAR